MCAIAAAPTSPRPARAARGAGRRWRFDARDVVRKGCSRGPRLLRLSRHRSERDPRPKRVESGCSRSAVRSADGRATRCPPGLLVRRVSDLSAANRGRRCRGQMLRREETRWNGCRRDAGGHIVTSCEGGEGGGLHGGRGSGEKRADRELANDSGRKFDHSRQHVCEPPPPGPPAPRAPAARAIGTLPAQRGRTHLMNAVFFGCKRAFHGCLRIARQLLAGFDLTPARFDMLTAVGQDHNQGCTQRELRTRLGVSAATISRMLRSLEELGLVDGCRQKRGDRRTRWLQLTLEGLRVAAPRDSTHRAIAAPSSSPSTVL